MQACQFEGNTDKSTSMGISILPLLGSYSTVNFLYQTLQQNFISENSHTFYNCSWLSNSGGNNYGIVQKDNNSKGGTAIVSAGLQISYLSYNSILSSHNNTHFFKNLVFFSNSGSSFSGNQFYENSKPASNFGLAGVATNIILYGY